MILCPQTQEVAVHIRRIGYGLSVLIISTLLSAGILSFIKAEGGVAGTDWYSEQPQIVKNFDYVDSPPSATPLDCVTTEVRVSRSPISTPYESHCMVPTAMGLVDKYAAVVQPQGYTTAYPIKFVMGGNPIIIPVRNQASSYVVMGYSNGLGSTIGMFKQLSNHLELKISASGMQYEVAGNNQFVDHSFKYSNGEPMRFNTGAWSFSENGRYSVIDTIWSGMVRIDNMNLTVQPFTESIMRTDGSTLLPAVTRISEDGQTALVAYNALGDWGSKYFKIVDVGSCTNVLAGSPSEKIPANCESTDIFPYLQATIPNLLTVDDVRFGSRHTLDIVVKTKAPDGPIKYANYSLISQDQQRTTKQYLAFGDSYISGEGALSYREGTDTARNQCHQSLVSYPYLLSSKFSSFASVACSGARLGNVVSSSDTKAKQIVGDDPSSEEIDHATENYIPGVILQTNFMRYDDPQAITISLGGNDIGFGQILEKCVHPTKNWQENQDTGHTCYSTYEDRAEVVRLINAQFTKWRSLYETLKNNNKNGRRVYVIGYPQVAKPNGDCGLNVQMNSEEVKFSYELIGYLNSVIQRAAQEAGVQYVDIQDAFNGHRLCEAPAGQAAINGFTITKNPRGEYDFKASYHPNQLGHRLIADSVAAQTSNLGKSMPEPSIRTNEIAFDPNLAILRDIPKVYRPEYTIKPMDDSHTPITERSTTFQQLIESKDFYTKPGATYQVELHSETRSLGSAVAGANGDLQINAVIPADIPLGFHTLHIYGSDVFGNPMDIQKVIFVVAGGEDSDGDGVLDAQDSCPLAVQSGVDIDHDAIDDACDPLIDTSPATDPNDVPEGIIWLDNAVLPITIEGTSGP